MCISALLQGGLGNQLFQIAAAYSLCIDYGDVCGFYLDNKIVHQGNIARTYKTSIYKKIREIPKSWSPDFTYYEKEGGFMPIPYKANMMLHGFFSNEAYLRNHKKEIIELFKDKETISQIRGQFKNSVSIHVRHGDYAKFQNVFIRLPLEYYKNALEYIDSKTHIDRIYVLSDDIKWCKENFKDQRIEFIEGFPDYIDLYIMTKCSHNILANSTFSWWGAYLNENEGKIVCVPSRWFVPTYRGAGWRSDVFLNEWIRIKIK